MHLKTLPGHADILQIVRSGSSTVLNSHLRGALSIMRERRTKRGPTSAFLERVSRADPPFEHAFF